ncbi:MAG: DnaA N-terminal domain-containing protein [Phascolarctobacterium sp.]|nr:DnaA N-terminal domain-containing protein [Phascolarctobacterium sp.]
MTEDFIGKGGALDEQFVAAVDNKLSAEVFSPFFTRASKEKPQLLPGLEKLKELMGENEFDKYINPIHNINLGDGALLIVTGNEQLRTILVGKYLENIKTAFNVASVRIIGGGRYGVDAF